MAKEQAEEEAVRRALTEQVAAVKPDLERLLAIATTLDLACARARYSLWLKPIHPTLSGGKRVKRSPCASYAIHLVWQQQHEQGQTVVPVDLLIQPQIEW
jgi:DNA mismatch repair protein MutS2